MTPGAGTSQILPQQGQHGAGAELSVCPHCSAHTEGRAAALGQILTNEYVMLHWFWQIQTFRDLGIIFAFNNATTTCSHVVSYRNLLARLASEHFQVFYDVDCAVLKHSTEAGNAPP